MTSVLGVPLFIGSIPDAINQLRILIESGEKRSNRIITATSAHGLVISQSDADFRKILLKSFWNLPDGIPSVWLCKLKGAKKAERCYGPDFFQAFMISSSGKNIKHFFCGGKPGVAEELSEVCNKKFNNKNVVGVYSPPFREMSDEELKNLALEINSKNADVVWIGLSTPKQEIFASRLAKFTNVHCICTVGAAFDFHTGNLRQAPRWLQRSGLEWAFRLLMEPKRLWKRYFVVVPLFLYHNIVELVCGKFFNNKIEEAQSA